MNLPDNGSFVEQGRKLVENAARIDADMRATFKAIDKLAARPASAPVRAKLAPATLHDAAASNPTLRAMLRKLQDMAEVKPRV